MDLLGSILGSMEAPPSMDAEEKKKVKEQKERMEKIQKQEKAKKQLFKEKVQKHINAFVKNPDKQKISFPSMDKVKRSIVHEIADVAGLAAFSFGLEEEDRYVALWKKEFAPGDDELNALKRGEVWDPDAKKKEEERKAELERELEASRVESEARTPATSYRDKYQHILNRGVAGIKTQYGMVPTANKSDKRTIEEVMADSRRKRQKLDDDEDSQPGSSS